MDFLRKLFVADDSAEEEVNPAISVDVGTSAKERRIKKRPTYQDFECFERIKVFFQYHWRGCLVLATPIFLTPLLHSNTKETKAGFVFVLVVIYTVSECIPVMVTSMLPIVLLPLLGILGSEDTCRSYFRDTTMVSMGGIIIAMSVEYCNLHRRLALTAIKLFSCYPRTLHMALMSITFCLSGMMSNTATTALMCPIVRAVLEALNEEGVMSIYEDRRKHESVHHRRPTRFAIAFYLGTAYSATIGGVGSLIGSGTNMAFKYEWQRIYFDLMDTDSKVQDKIFIKYEHFFGYCFPIAVLLLCSTYLYLQIYLMGLWRPNSVLALKIRESNLIAKQKRKVFKEKYKNQPKITVPEVSISVLIIILLLLYFFRNPDFMQGWAQLVSNKMQMKAALPTNLIVFLIFLLPSSYSFLNYCRDDKPLPDKSIPALLTWKYLHENMPWSLMFVVGGGFAIGKANKISKLVDKVAAGLLEIRATTKSKGQLIFEIIILSMFLTAFSSNVSVFDQLMGFLAEVCSVTKTHPIYLFFPSVLACSMAFHLPVSTPPNAIACGYGNIRNKDIIYAGIGPTISAIVLLQLFCMFWVDIIYKDKLDEYPSWANDFNRTA